MLQWQYQLSLIVKTDTQKSKSDQKNSMAKKLMKTTFKLNVNMQKLETHKFTFLHSSWSADPMVFCLQGYFKSQNIF